MRRSFFGLVFRLRQEGALELIGGLGVCVLRGERAGIEHVRRAASDVDEHGAFAHSARFVPLFLRDVLLEEEAPHLLVVLLQHRELAQERELVRLVLRVVREIVKAFERLALARIQAIGRFEVIAHLRLVLFRLREIGQHHVDDDAVVAVRPHRVEMLLRRRGVLLAHRQLRGHEMRVSDSSDRAGAQGRAPFSRVIGFPRAEQRHRECMSTCAEASFGAERHRQLRVVEVSCGFSVKTYWSL